MKMLVVRSSALSRHTTLRRCATVALCAAFALPTGPLHAQTTLTHTEDAAPVPRGWLRFRINPTWTRYDERFATTGRTPADNLSADPLGAQQLPNLAPLDAAVRTLSNDPAMRLSLGTLVTRGDARIATTPISLEYGVTRRLSIGVMVPVVQTRHVIQIDVNSRTGAPANVGYLLAGDRTTAFVQNIAAAASLDLAASRLAALITHCQAIPTASDCTAYGADPTGVAAARSQATASAAAARSFGVNAAATLLAPRAGGSLAVEIELQRNALNQRLQQYLGTTAPKVDAVYFAGGANADLSYLDLQGSIGVPGLLKSDLGGGLDSIHTTERLGVGDIQVGAQFLVFDAFQHDTLPRRRLQSRLVVGGSVRFATSRPDSALNLTDIATGDGAGFELRSALDLLTGRFGGTLAARYVKHRARSVFTVLAGDPDAAGWPEVPMFGLRDRTAGDEMTLDVTPRVFVNEWLAVQGYYGLERTGAPTYSGGLQPPCQACVSVDFNTIGDVPTASRTAQRLGLGLRYSTVDAYSRGQARYPVEVSFTHLETTSGDAGLPKLARDQIQMRVFFRVTGP